MNQNTYSNIIVRMPNWIGDFVMATPILQDLRNAFPKSTITAFCKKPLGDLLEKDPHVDEIFSFIKPQMAARRLENRDILEKLQEGHYDLGVLLTNSFSSAWWFFRGKVQERIGFHGNFFRRWLLSRGTAYPANKEKQHQVLTYKCLLSLLDIPISQTPPKLYLSADEKKEARLLLKNKGVPQEAKIIGINPGAAYGSAKCWPEEYFRTLSKKLLKHPDHYLVFFGDASQTPLVKAITKELGSKAINFSGATSLRDLMGLLSNCHLLLTNDSGPMHMADALGVKVVALFGSTSEIMTGPYNTGIVLHKHVACSPCFKRVCPIDFRCMKTIEPEEVYEAIVHQLHPLAVFSS